VSDVRTALADRLTEVGDRGLEHCLGLDRDHLGGSRPHAGVLQQTLDEGVHARRAVHGVMREFLARRIDLALEPRLQHLDAAAHRTQGFLEIVRGDIGELLELGVGALEIALAIGEFEVHRLEFVLRLPHGRDVITDDHELMRTSRLVQHGHDRRVDPEVRAVLGTIADVVPPDPTAADGLPEIPNTARGSIPS
jgi:hypothetical protein